jgi:hypothetical protein
MRLRLLAAALIVLGAGPVSAAKVVVTVDKQSQEMTVTVDGRQEYIWPVSTGIAKYATPSGTYQPFRMEEVHFSEEWDDAAMPNSIFFTRLGHAIHGTEHIEKLGERASHGCVRLDPANAATLFALVQEVGLPNTSVIIAGAPAVNTNSAAVLTKGAAKKVNKTALVPSREPIPLIVEEEGTETVDISAPENDVDYGKRKKRELWPYERLN